MKELMVSGQNSKMKIVWVCHFSNEEIKKLLKVKREIAEYAPWISLGIKEAEKRNDIELHIVAPYKYLKKNVEFELRGVVYHFYNVGIPLVGRHWPRFFRWDSLTNYRHSKNKIYKLISKIKPDIIHLHGLENPYYSIIALDKRVKIPFLVTVQGFVSKARAFKKNYAFNKRVKFELEIIRRQQFFGVRNSEMQSYLKEMNSNAHLLWHEYFVNRPFLDTLCKIKYDLIFFARISKDKGIEDLINAVGLLKERGSSLELAVLGSGNSMYMKKLKELCVSLKIDKHVHFLGFQETQQDVYRILAQSKISVLPTHNDIIPGTIVESMFAQKPVVSYKTGGIPEINENEECILIGDVGDLDTLSKNIIRLIENNEDYELYRHRAYNYAIKRWSNRQALEEIIGNYYYILSKSYE